MLGFTSSRKPVSGVVAREIREQLIRISTDNLSETDIQMKSKQALVSDYVLVQK